MQRHHQPSYQNDLPMNSDTDLPELTEKESAELILNARKEKGRRLAVQAYWDRVNADMSPVSITPAEMAEVAKSTFYASEGRHFEIDNDNRQVFEDLCNYFTETPGRLDLNKGIFMIGNVGSGKTEMMRIFTANPYASYCFVRCRVLVDEFKNRKKDDDRDIIKSYSVLRKSAKPHPYNAEYLGTGFDDLGTEDIPVNYFGNTTNVMASILLNRYDYKHLFKYTHITTNLPKTGSKSLEEYYGTRVMDRIQEMMNIVVLNGKSRRK